MVGDRAKAMDLLEPLLLKMPYYLSPAWLRIDPTFAPLKGDARFERLAASARRADLEAAATLARGPFLAGFALRDSPAFDDWQAGRAVRAERAVAIRAEAPTGPCAASQPTLMVPVICVGWYLQWNLYEPAGRSTFTVADSPASASLLTLCPSTVKLCSTEPVLENFTVPPPLGTLSAVGVNAKSLALSVIVAADPDAGALVEVDFDELPP